MLKIILNEFVINGYVIMGDSEGDGLFYLKHSKYEDYWMVCYGNFSLYTQSDMYEQYLERFASQYPRIRKNTSLIILAKEGADTPEEIVAIENDPYLFKKYYLPYSQESVDGLNALLTNHGDGLLPIEQVMLNPDLFAHLKEETSVGTYHLLYAIAHKLPILPVQVNHEELLDIDLQLNEDQQYCLEWCMGLSDNVEERRVSIEQFSKEEE